MTIIYKEGELVRYRVLYSPTFSPYFNYVALGYLSVFHKEIDTFDARFSESTFCCFTGSGLSGFLFHIMYWYVDVYSGVKHRFFLMIYHNALVHYYIYGQSKITQSEEYDRNNEFACDNLSDEL